MRSFKILVLCIFIFLNLTTSNATESSLPPNLHPRLCEEVGKTLLGAKGDITLNLSNAASTELTAPEHAFLYDIFYPLIGPKAEVPGLNIRKTNHGFLVPAIVFGSSVQMPSYNFNFTHNSYIQITKNENGVVVEIPFDFKISDLVSADKNILYQIFSNHPLHPYIKSSLFSNQEYQFQPKEAQLEGVKAARAAIERGDDRYMFVGTTGLGKSYVMFKVLKALTEYKRAGLYIITADQVNVVQQLKDEMLRNEDFNDLGLDASAIVYWDGLNTPHFQTLIEQVSARERQGLPTFLFTVIRSLNLQTVANSTSEVGEEHIKKLSQITNGLFYDEAHHIGASQVSQLVRRLLDEGPHFFLYGTTATPIHYESSIIEEIFQGRVFWGNIDKASNYIEETKPGQGPRQWSYGNIVKQLKTTIALGEIRGIDNLYLLKPGQKGVPADLHIHSGDGHRGDRYHLNQNHFSWISDNLGPLFLKHRQGFMAVPKVEDANLLTEHLSLRVPAKRFAAYHSDLSSKESLDVLNAFRKGEIDFLVTVRRLDEAIDIPNMSLYIDLNHEVGPRQFLQRIGRVTRLAEGKGSVDVVTLFDMNESQLHNNLEFFNELLNGGLFSKVSISNSTEQNLGVVFNRQSTKEHSEAMSAFSKIVQLEDHRQLFWNNGVLEIRNKNSDTKAELLEYIAMWFEEYPSWPRTSNPELLSAEENLIRSYIVRLGGQKVVAKLLLDKGISTPQIIAKSSLDNRILSAINWIASHRKWPDRRSNDKTERLVGEAIYQHSSSRKEFWKSYKEQINFPLVAFEIVEERPRLLREWLASREQQVGYLRVDLPDVSLSDGSQNSQIELDEMGLQLAKWLRSVTYEVIADFLKDNGLVDRYPLVQYKLNRVEYFKNWVRRNNRLPKNVAASVTSVKATHRIEVSLYNWFKNQKPQMQAELKKELHSHLRK